MQPFVALVTAALGSAMTFVGAVLGAGTEVAPWAQAGGTATAVAALAYVAKMLADGRLVARPVSELERKSEDRERALVEMLREAGEREDAYRALLLAHGLKP